jgi:hephaestin
MRCTTRPAVAAVIAIAAVIAAVTAASGAAPASPHHGHATARAAAAGPVTRTYYIAADEVEWNYAPQGRNAITGRPFDDAANVFVARGVHRIGATYRKALYREYTDATFTHLKPVAPEWRHLGTLGPVIRAAVGDTIRVVFRNHAGRPYSIHAHGVRYGKDGEGAPYDDGTTGADRADDAVAPGDTFTYVYEVPERAGPGPHDPNSVMWMYHSHVDEIQDTNSGLMGPMIITAAGQARPDGRPVGVDREFIANFTVMNENQSWYRDDNIARYAGDPGGVDPDDEGFEESNLMHSINGYVYGNQPLMRARNGEHVRWYVMGMGTEVDLHTPHWHGQTVESMGMRTDVVELLPASMKIADMTADNPGTWLFHCHVNDHIAAGMMTRYAVSP